MEYTIKHTFVIYTRQHRFTPELIKTAIEQHNKYFIGGFKVRYGRLQKVRDMLLKFKWSIQRCYYIISHNVKEHPFKKCICEDGGG